MKHQIKHRHTNAVLFECAIPDGTASAVHYALSKALISGADRSGADRSGADLSGANLSGANLSDETINEPPISLINPQWPVLITGQYMRIGCRRHTHEQWRNFPDRAISDMEGKALAFWHRWKQPLLSLCDAHSDSVALGHLRESSANKDTSA